MMVRFLPLLALCGISSVLAGTTSSPSKTTSTAKKASSAAPAAAATPSVTPLTDRHYTYPNLPYQVDTVATGRGPQSGYTLCNSTTQNQDSLCQVSFIDSADDFCVWSATEPDSTIGDIEAAAVAWCTKTGHGTRLIPKGAITAVQFMRTSAYVQVTGLINQDLIDLDPTDGGGELDPHGDDERGNPLGSLVFSNAFPSNGGNNNTYQQVIEWHNFMGSGIFCFKACDPAGAHAADYCQHLFDRIGCAYNAPAAYAPGVFESCDGDLQDFPGVYTNSAGQVVTYVQPPESLGPISTMPYTPRIPASSNCVTFNSADLFADLPTPTAAIITSTPDFSGDFGASSSAATSTSTTSTSSGMVTTATPAFASTMALTAFFGAFLLMFFA